MFLIVSISDNFKVIFISLKFDLLAKKHICRFFVIPATACRLSFSGGAKRESRNSRRLQTGWIPAFAGMTTFCESIEFNRHNPEFN